MAQETLADKPKPKEFDKEIWAMMESLRDSIDGIKYTVRLLSNINDRLNSIDNDLSGLKDRLTMIEMCLKAKGFLEEEVK